MSIDPTIAEAIVASIKGVIRHNINFFNTQGIIIASTDATRVGTAHAAARQVLDTGTTVNVDAEHRYEGARNGINMPVIFNESVIAVIGITGPVEEVMPFGTIVKKMTEILIRENVEHVVEFDRRMRMSNLMTLLTLRHHDESLLSYLAAALEIDLERPRQAAVGRFLDPDEPFAQPDELQKLIAQAIDGSHHSLFRITERGCDLLLDQRPRHDWAAQLERVQDDVTQRFHRSMVFAVGTVADTDGDYWRSYQEAATAMRWQLFSRQTSVCAFTDLDLGLLITTMPDQGATVLLDRVFAGLDDTAIDDYAKVFDAYTRHNGSVTHAAEEPFIHKNTMQNRLNAIATATGYNPRQPCDYTTLRVAFALRDYRRFMRASHSI